ncbi:MAG: hypothetical protein HY735_01745 [Verrucomicrobia bacterium]|nr:hypothetical protein [Verrucomicrobiota bacterium]
MNTEGTKLAVVRPENSARESLAEAVKSVLEARNVQYKQIEGENREKTIKEFQSRKGWYRGAEVDELSKREADLIAARLVRRVQAKVTLSEEKAKALEAAFAAVFKRRFTRAPDQSDQAPLAQRNSELLKAAREHLDEQGMTALKEALRAGYRPQTGEP